MIEKFIKGRQYFLNADCWYSPVIFTPYESGICVAGQHIYQNTTRNGELKTTDDRPDLAYEFSRYINITDIHDSEEGFIIELD